MAETPHGTSAPGASGGSAAPGALGHAGVVVASNRAARGVYEDTTGPLIVDFLRELGFEVTIPVVVPDGEPVGQTIAGMVAEHSRVVLTTGGTGLTPTDRTPEVTRPLLDFEVPGIAEAIRAAGLAKGVPTAMLSRGLAGVSRRTLVVNLPGSRGGVKDALEVLRPVLVHAVEQIAGGDHPRVDPAHAGQVDDALGTEQLPGL